MFYAVEILSHKKPLGVPWICGVYDARSKLPVGACAILARARRGAIFLTRRARHTWQGDWDGRVSFLISSWVVRLTKF